MNAEKFIELQEQMRENNEEVSDFLKDFGYWKQQVELKNAHLQKESSTGNQKLPAIRNSLFKKQKKKRVPETICLVKRESQRIPSSDYRAWDKFDVDKALEELDNPAQNSTSKTEDESSETDEELENHRRLILAKEARELGNLRFKEGKLQEAIEQYTTSVRLTPEDPVPYTNRALAFLKSERYASAESDCSAALALDKKCIKALFRRALARKGLQKNDEAIEDLKTLLAIEENNKAAIIELTSLTGKSFKLENTTPISPSVPKISLRGSRKLRRVPIVEVGGGTGFRGSLGMSPKLQTDSVLSDGDTTSSASRSLKPNSSLKSKMTYLSGSITEDPNIQQCLNPSFVSSTRGEIPQDSRTKPIFVPPSNWYQLERDLRELNNGPILSPTAIDYLCAMEPADYATIISSNLEPILLSKLLRALYATDLLTAEQIASRLNALSHLPRFDVAWCLADDQERDLFKQLLRRIESSEKPSAELKQHLRTVYAL